MWQIGVLSMAMAHIYNLEGTTIDLLDAAQSESVMERNRHSKNQGDSLQKFRRRNRFKFIAFHDYDTSDPGGLLQKWLHPKPISQPKKTSLDWRESKPHKAKKVGRIG